MLYKDKNWLYFIDREGYIYRFWLFSDDIQIAVQFEKIYFKDWHYKTIEDLHKKFKKLYQQVDTNERYFIGFVKTPAWKGILFIYKNKLMASSGTSDWVLTPEREKITKLISYYEDMAEIENERFNKIKNYMPYNQMMVHLINYTNKNNIAMNDSY